MTAPNGPILFNNVSGGSDTEASGLGPTPAVFGAGASTTAASVTVTGIDTTGVSVGDLLWVSSSSGRQFSIIATIIDGTSVTCDETFDNTESGRTWAIGGKRANFSGSMSIFSYTISQAIIATETDQTISTAISINATRSLIGLGSGDPKAIIQTTSGANCISSTSTDSSIANLWLQNSSGTPSPGLSGSGTRGCNVSNCWFGSPTNPLSIAITTFGDSSTVSDSMFLNVTRVYSSGGAGNSLNLINCYVKSGFINASAVSSRSNFINCLFVGLTSPVNGTNSSSNWLFNRCFFVDFTDSAIELASSRRAVIVNCVFIRNAGYGIEVTTNSITTGRGNFFYNNTMGEISPSNLYGIDGSTTLTADPFVWSKTLTAVSWTFATKRLNKTGGFGGVHVGQSVNVTGGTGVTPGLYAIASVDSDDQITLVASIAGADTADVTTEPDWNINNHAGGGAALRAATVVLP